jgi:uncharacterized protein DUF6968
VVLLRSETCLSNLHQAKEESAMNNGNIGEIIATRQLYYFDEEHQKRAVSVIVGKPEPSPDSSEYQCLFQLIGIGSQHTQTARGHDSIQALQSALILVAANLNYLNDQLGRRLVWEGAAKGELGFP